MRHYAGGGGAGCGLSTDSGCRPQPTTVLLTLVVCMHARLLSPYTVPCYAPTPLAPSAPAPAPVPVPAPPYPAWNPTGTGTTTATDTQRVLLPKDTNDVGAPRVATMRYPRWYPSVCRVDDNNVRMLSFEAMVAAHNISTALWHEHMAYLMTQWSS